MTKISAVTFDLWQTLLMDTQEQGRARMQVRLDGAVAALAKSGRVFDPEHVREAYRACYRTCHAIRAEERDVAFGHQVEIFIGHIEDGLLAQLPKATVGEITDAYCDSFYVYPPRWHEDAAEVLREVKADGYKIGLISNTGMTPGYAFRAFLEQADLARYFDIMAFSDEMLLAKPSVAMFDRTLRDMETAPEDTVHIGDHLKNDVLGAKAAGLRTIWIETHDDRREPVEVVPDVTVKTLGEVADGVRRLAREAA